MSDLWDESILKAEQLAASGDYAKAEQILLELIAWTETLPREDKRKFIVLELMAELMMAQQRNPETETYLQRAADLRKQRYGNLHRRYAEGLARLAAFYFEQERYQEAEPLSREVVFIYEKLYGSAAEEVGRAMLALAETLHAIGNVGEAEDCYKRALSIRRELTGTSLDADSVNIIQRYADLLEEMGRKDEADFLIASAQGRVSGIFKLIQVKPQK